MDGFGFSFDDQNNDEQGFSGPQTPSPFDSTFSQTFGATTGGGLVPTAGPVAPGSAGPPALGPQTPAVAPTPAGTPAKAPTGTGGPAGTLQTRSEGDAYRQSRAYADTLRQINDATDPTQAAMLQDKLGRELFQTLTQQGHDVKWQGDQLMVDGRPYVVGRRRTAMDRPAGAAMPVADQPREDLEYADGSNSGVTGTSDPTNQAEAPVATPDGGGADPNNPEAFIQQLLSTVPYGHDGLKGLTDAFKQAGYTVWTDGQGTARGRITHDATGRVFQVTGPGEGMDWRNNPTATQWGFQALGNGGGGGAAPGGGGGQDYSQIIDQLLGHAQTGIVEPVAPVSPVEAPAFKATGPTYTPGAIDTSDIPGTMGPIDTTALAGPVGGQVDGLFAKLLANPESMDAATVDKLKAKSKDELAEMYALDQENAGAEAASMGIDDSRWFASQRKQAGRDRDKTLVNSNRGIDIEAARTNMEDRRSAAALGASYAGQKSSTELAARQLVSDHNLRRAAVAGDRMALRESVNQAAAQLGQDADRLQLDYTLALMRDATDRYGIDVEQYLDLKRLSQQDRQFLEDLAFRFAQLGQDDRQFGASYGLNLAELQHRIDMDNWDRLFGDED